MMNTILSRIIIPHVVTASINFRSSLPFINIMIKFNPSYLETDHVHWFLEPQADECGQRVVQHQEHDGINEVVPIELRVHLKHPGVGAVTEHHRRNTKQTEKEKQKLGFELGCCW